MNQSTNGSLGGTRTPDWELDCEICLRHGINQVMPMSSKVILVVDSSKDDGQPMMSCGVCNKWQHINCHDNADYAAGHSRRNWAVEEFICRRCQYHTLRTAEPAPHLTKLQATGQPRPPVQISYVQPSVHGKGYAGAPSHPPTQNIGQQGHHIYGSASTAPTMPPPRVQQSQPAITFAHYQPDPQGFSNRQTYQRDQQMPPRVYPQHQPYATSMPHQPHPMQVSLFEYIHTIFSAHIIAANHASGPTIATQQWYVVTAESCYVQQWLWNPTTSVQSFRVA